MVFITLRGVSYSITHELTLDIFSRSIDLEIGANASILVFKTAKLIYGIDYDTDLPGKFDLFLLYLERTLGCSRFNRIIDNALTEFEKNHISSRKNRKKVKAGRMRID